MKRSGYADLPLHGGSVPHWLAQRMTRLGTAIVESVLFHYGESALLSRLSDPFWFQALGSVMGMDWHSSGITTSVMAALKRGVNPRARELGIHICGGRGKQSRQTPHELRALALGNGLDGDSLVRASRLTAKIDNNCLVDGFQLYLHSFVVTAKGEWTVIQQGMNPKTGMARRYHWHSLAVKDFVREPHTGIAGEHQGLIMNLVHAKAAPAQAALLALMRERPDRNLEEIRHLVMPRHHEVRAPQVDLKRLGAVLALAHEQKLHDFAELLLVDQMGPRTLQTLALVAEVIHGTPVRFSDPARYSFALGGKDGHPFPVPLKTYDETLNVLRRSLETAKVDGGAKMEGLRRLHHFVKEIEAQTRPEADFEAALAHERALSPALDGRTVFSSPAKTRQLNLF